MAITVQGTETTPEVLIMAINLAIVDGILNKRRVGHSADLIEESQRLFPEVFLDGAANLFRWSDVEVLALINQNVPHLDLRTGGGLEWIAELRAELERGRAERSTDQSSELLS